MSNYNKDQELKLGAKITKKDTEATLDDILKHVIDIVHPTDSSWDGALVAMNKTMIACRRQNQAMYVKKYLAKKNITSSLSICDTDSKSEEIEKFKNDKNSSVLIVVGRGILGFNYPDLINVIDMTCSQNINKIFQLMARVLRKKETYQKKVYYKVFPHKLSIKFNYIMNVVMCLTDREYFLKFTGKNEDELKIPIKRLPGFGGPSIGPGPGPDPKIDPKIEDLEEELINYSGIPTIEFFNKILNQKNEDVFSPLAWTTIKEVNDKISKIQNKQYLPNHWNLENCIASASRWINRKLWKENEQSAYNAARINGWLEICCKHMDKTDNNINWTLELCLASAKKCGSVKEWMNVDINAYLAARRHDWFGICSAHMTKRNRTEWTLNLLKIDRAKHPSKNAWKKNSRTAYKAAQRNGWLKEIE